MDVQCVSVAFTPTEKTCILYNGPGVEDGCYEATKEMMGRVIGLGNESILTVKSLDFLTSCASTLTNSVLVIPGGTTTKLAFGLKSVSSRIRSLVEHGLCVHATCSAAMYLSQSWEFDTNKYGPDAKHSMHPELSSEQTCLCQARPGHGKAFTCLDRTEKTLGLIDHPASGPVYFDQKPHPKWGLDPMRMSKIKMSTGEHIPAPLRGKSISVLDFNSPLWPGLSEESDGVVATYQGVSSAADAGGAILMKQYGKGRVWASGPHVEADPQDGASFGKPLDVLFNKDTPDAVATRICDEAKLRDELFRHSFRWLGVNVAENYTSYYEKHCGRKPSPSVS